jgi:hypothetical protein
LPDGCDVLEWLRYSWQGLAMQIRCELIRIMISETEDQQVIVLKEAEGDRIFPIVIGFFEAAAIDRRIKGHVLPRPMTHDLLGMVIEALGGRLTRVCVTDLKDHTFYANLVIERNKDQILVADVASQGLKGTAFRQREYHRPCKPVTGRDRLDRR